MLKKDSTQVRPLVLLIFAVAGTAVGIFGWIFFISSNVAWVAHDLGGIDGKTGTPSREAFEASYQRGFRSFHLDLMLTLDDQVCAFSHWGPLEKELGIAKPLGQIDARTFLSKRLYDKYQPLCLEQLTSLLKQYNDAIFVIEVKDSRSANAVENAKKYSDAYKRVFQKLFRAWAESRELWSRVVPLIHHEADLTYLKSFYRFPSVMYSLDRTNSTEDAVVLLVKKFPEITAVVMNKQRFSKTLASNMKAAKRGLYVTTVNDVKEAKELFGRGASGFFTDTLEPTPQFK